jgi:hypothetical protein
MITWTESAKAALEEYLARACKQTQAAGADEVEVSDDLRRHVEAEVAARKLEVVTANDLENITRRLGWPEPAPAEKPAPSTSIRATGESPGREPLRPFLLLVGVIFPVIAILIELGTRMSAGIYYDPMPDGWHLALLASVPAIQLLAWLAIRKVIPSWHRWLGPLCGFSMGLMIYYSLLYAPLAPFACIAIVFYGIGLLPLTPLFTLIAGIRMFSVLKDRARRGGIELRGFKRGMVAGVAALILIPLPLVLTRLWSQDYAAGSPQEQLSAIRKLRIFGRERVLLQDCYASEGRGGGGAFGLYLQGKPVSAEDARSIYYRVTGDAFNSKAPPQRGFSAARWNFLDELSWDDEAGGAAVGGRLKGLSLAQSRMDGLLNADAATSYTEWILEFKNVAQVEREARAQIQLPPGGVVSRLTLWVNGEEREAAFAGASQVREAYQQVVRVQRRDPVLVTSSGPDRVLMQCFPVPRDGGTIKVRLGISAPLHLETPATGVLVWPRMIERNFVITEHFEHSLWVEAKQPLQAANRAFKGDRSKPGTFGLRAQLSDATIAEPDCAVRLTRDPQVVATWVLDPHGASGEFIQQRIETRAGTAPSRAVILLDGSKAMRAAREQVADVLRKLPDGLEVAVLFAGDTVEEWNAAAPAGTALIEATLRKLVDADFVGGRDNLPALLRAWDLAAEKPGSVVLWVHGPQPQLVEKSEQIEQRVLWRFGKEAPVIHGLQTAPGPDRITEKIHGKAAMVSVPRLGSVRDDLQRLLDSWNPGKTRLELVRQRHEASDIEKGARGKESSRHLARLWANEEVRRLLNANQRDTAVRLAGKYQLVTSVSGAVVLETKQQFEQAGLEPVNPDTVPTVPEPGAVLLLLLSAGLLLLLRLRKRFTTAAGSQGIHPGAWARSGRQFPAPGQRATL